MLVGLLSLVMLKTAESNKENEEYSLYIYSSLLLAGIASIIKQSGLAFVIFNILYIFCNFKNFHNRRILFGVMLASLAYFLSYLFLFYQYADNPIGNLEHLKRISVFSSDKEFLEKVARLAKLFMGNLTGIVLLPVMIISGLLCFKKKAIQNNPLGYLSMVFFLIGFIAWVIFFSYDSRNARWVKSFLIIATSVSFNYFNYNKIWITIKNIQKYPFYSFLKKYIFLVLGIFCFLISLPWLIKSDDFVYQQQKIKQSQIGDANLAKTVTKLIKKKEECVIAVMNIQPTKYNYFAKEVFDKIIQTGAEAGGYLHYYHNNTFPCAHGYYWVMGGYRKDEREANHWNWKKIEQLEEDGKIIRVHDKYYIFFIPPKNKK